MRTFKTETYVGLFVLAGMALFIFGTMQITQLGEEKGYELSAVFDNAAGLEINAPVRMVGVTVGRVKDISIYDRKARVTLIIRKGFSVDKGAELSIRSQGILGDKYVEISPGAASESYRSGETVIKTRAVVDLDRLLESLQTAGQDLSAILASLRKVVATQEGEDSMRDILANTRALTANISSLIADNRQKVDSILSNLESLTGRLDGIASDNREEIKAAISNIRQVSEDIRESLPRLTAKLEEAADQVGGVVSENRENVKATVERIRRDAELLEETLESVRTVAKRIEEGQGTVGKLINEDTAYENLNDTLTGINKALKKADELKILVDIHGNYLSEVEGTKGYLTLDLYPNPGKFYRLELVDDPEGLGTWKNTTTTITDTSGTTVTQKEEITYEDKLKFSIEMGKRFHDTVFRLGYIESSFGFGLDRYHFNDRLRFSFDAWELDREQNPRMRLAMIYRFLNVFHLDVGMDDFVNSDRDPNFLVGVGLSFVDEDLKYLLSKAPIP